MKQVKPIILILLLITQTTFLYSQLNNKKSYKNTIKYNTSHPLIFGLGSIIVGYERVLNKHQSFTLHIGKAVLPSLSVSNNDSFSLASNKTKGGFHFSGEYRFYLPKENVGEAPHGVYIGPYFSYNHFKNKNTWDINSANFTGKINTELMLKAHTFGFEVGYQFLLGRRMTIDMILVGPGFAFYNLKASLTGNLSQSDKELIYKKLNEKLGDKLPGYNLVMGDNYFQTQGNSSTTGLNYRYMIHWGFRL